MLATKANRSLRELRIAAFAATKNEPRCALLIAAAPLLFFVFSRPVGPVKNFGEVLPIGKDLGWALLLLLSLPLQAQELRPEAFVRQGWAVGVGIVPDCYDSYLSPNTFGGYSVDIAADSWRRSAGNEYLFHQSSERLSGGFVSHGNAAELFVSSLTTRSWAFRMLDADGFRLYAGPQALLRVGAVYNPQNTNNPSNAKVGLHAAAMGLAEYRSRCWGCPLRVSYQLDLPLLGAFFSPEYTQSYYEIFSHRQMRGTVHAATPANCFSSSHAVTLDLSLRAATLRLQLLSDVDQWHTSTSAYCLTRCAVAVGLVRTLYPLTAHEETRLLPY